jgi:hypothetical protein
LSKKGGDSSFAEPDAGECRAQPRIPVLTQLTTPNPSYVARGLASGCFFTEYYLPILSTLRLDKHVEAGQFLSVSSLATPESPRKNVELAKLVLVGIQVERPMVAPPALSSQCAEDREFGAKRGNRAGLREAVVQAGGCRHSAA